MAGEHVTDWSGDAAAAGFEEFDSGLWWRLGYSALPPLLGIEDGAGRTLLDLGCGPGEVATWIAREFRATAIGVDSSEAMLRSARQRAGDLPVRFQRGEAGATGLPDDSVDGAWAAFVAVCLPHLEALRAMARELARVLRPGGTAVLLDSHPDTTGTDFGDLVQGEPGATYRPGDPLPVRMRRRDGSWERITDTYWAGRTYDEVLSEAGFTGIEHHAPLLTGPDVPQRWSAAATEPPFLLVTARLPDS